ncbi:UDP-N-acetylmuramoyl-L-alanyl-D-glutamate--2,6-diaminopimelate ligase [Spirochaetota bacterium]
MKLAELLSEAQSPNYRADPNVEIAGLAYDSRDVKNGYAFFAFQGLHTDGHKYIDNAIKAGAVAIIHDKELENYNKSVCYAKLPDARLAMPMAAAKFYDKPSGKMAVIGVSGTEGKSTCVWLIHSLLELAGKKSGFFSTVEYKLGSKVEANPKHQTTPEAITVQEHLAKMAASGFEYAVVEASSHGLSSLTGRLEKVDFDAGLICNIRHEHLEFHGSWENYRNDKANLFRILDVVDHYKTLPVAPKAVPSFGIVCANDPSLTYLQESTKKPVYSYSMHSSDADIYAENIKLDDSGAFFDLVEKTDKAEAGFLRYSARLNLPGSFNIENALAAILMVSKITGIEIKDLFGHLPLLSPVRGRMNRIYLGQEFEVLVDYAHTPSSFETIMPSLAKATKGEMVCVFGSGGERDVKKRPQQGSIAAKYCGTVILSDEDPRGEDPMALLEDIAAGCASKERGKNLFLIPDRKKAIRFAMNKRKKGDLVLLLGKGHENSIEYKDHSIPWDEIAEAEAALAELGFCKNRD